MQYIEQLVKERQEIKPLWPCVSYFLTIPKKNIYGVSVIRFASQKNVHIDTRFLTDTDEEHQAISRKRNVTRKYEKMLRKVINSKKRTM